MKNQTMISNTPVIVRLHESTINAQTMTLHWGESRAVFEGNVRTHIEREPDAAAAGQPDMGTVTVGGEATTAFTINLMARGRQLNGARRRRVASGAAGALVALLALACPAAWAQTPIGGFSGLGGNDSKQPHRHRIRPAGGRRQKHTAIFIGNVSATDGGR